MVTEPGFFAALLRPFETVPDLFAASAQILFPEGRRREETGKTVMNPGPGVNQFPVQCDIPLEGEDHSYVLYGSGGCTLYDAAKLEALGGFDEVYKPAYVEDLDLGVRAWTRGWPTVYCAGARVLHQHRATTSRYFTPEELDRALEINYVQFLARAVGDRETFLRLWRHNVLRLKAQEKEYGLSSAAHQASRRPTNQAGPDVLASVTALVMDPLSLAGRMFDSANRLGAIFLTPPASAVVTVWSPWGTVQVGYTRR